MNKSETQPLVSIQCLVYNHEPYLRDCLNGFVMQQTDFPFEAIVHDDCSTDHSADIIREYAAKYPDIIKPIYETENQYSKGEGILHQIMMETSRGKYVAICEGDDYWTDPLKLQKQVSFLESHPNYSMCCASACVDYGKEKKIRGVSRDMDVTPEEAIVKGGGFIPTLSIMYRKDLSDGYDFFHKGAKVGDYPLQIYCCIRGKVRYFKDIVGVYRCGTPGSWTDTTWSDKDSFISFWRSEVNWFKYVDRLTNWKYHNSFSYVIGKDLFSIADWTRDYKSLKWNKDVLFYAYHHFPFWHLITLFLRIYFNNIYQFVKREKE